LLTQAPPGIDSLELRIKQFLKDRDRLSGKVYLGVPHRLDRPASGIMLFAKNPRATKKLAFQFQIRTIVKKYWAVVEGQVACESGTWVDWMRKLPDQAQSEITEADAPDSKEAILSFRVAGRTVTQTWLEIQLQTGRTHQIRLQASHRGHPIIGDELYGSAISFGVPTNDIRSRWIALHAREISFEHPTTLESTRSTADLWSPWTQLAFDFPKSNDT
jgi:23S rRNA pseudouridine1911/1915/1917 synthase